MVGPAERLRQGRLESARRREREDRDSRAWRAVRAARHLYHRQGMRYVKFRIEANQTWRYTPGEPG